MVSRTDAAAQVQSEIETPPSRGVSAGAQSVQGGIRSALPVCDPSIEKGHGVAPTSDEAGYFSLSFDADDAFRGSGMIPADAGRDAYRPARCGMRSAPFGCGSGMSGMHSTYPRPASQEFADDDPLP